LIEFKERGLCGLIGIFFNGFIGVKVPWRVEDLWVIVIALYFDYLCYFSIYGTYFHLSSYYISHSPS
jgi:hypothetical protein